MTDATGLAMLRQTSEGVTELRLDLAPGQSIVLKTLEEQTAEGAPWPILEEEGPPMVLQGPWEVTFINGGPTLPEPMTMTQLASWTEAGGQATERFAGTARYTTTFDLPERDTTVWRLELGRVAESARIRINGHDLGVLFVPPMQVDIPGECLQKAANTLEVEVTNLSANRIRGLDQDGVPWRKFYDINFVDINYKPFDASNWPVRDSGLLGPVSLQSMEKIVNELESPVPL